MEYIDEVKQFDSSTSNVIRECIQVTKSIELELDRLLESCAVVQRRLSSLKDLDIIKHPEDDSNFMSYSLDYCNEMYDAWESHRSLISEVDWIHRQIGSVFDSLYSAKGKCAIVEEVYYE